MPAKILYAILFCYHTLQMLHILPLVCINRTNSIVLWCTFCRLQISEQTPFMRVNPTLIIRLNLFCPFFGFFQSFLQFFHHRQRSLVFVGFDRPEFVLIVLRQPVLLRSHHNNLRHRRYFISTAILKRFRSFEFYTEHTLCRNLDLCWQTFECHHKMMFIPAKNRKIRHVKWTVC